MVKIYRLNYIVFFSYFYTILHMYTLYSLFTVVRTVPARLNSDPTKPINFLANFNQQVKVSPYNIIVYLHSSIAQEV